MFQPFRGGGLFQLYAGISAAAVDLGYLRKNQLQAAATDFLELGAAPGVTAAVNVDGSSFGNRVLRGVNGTVDFQVQVSNASTILNNVSNHVLSFAINNVIRWNVQGGAATSELSAAQATARIIGGATNGLAIRNSGNTRDNFVIADAGTQASLGNGTQSLTLATAGVNGELPAGAFLYGGNSVSGLTLLPENGATAGRTIVFGYWAAGPAPRSAVEVTNVAAGFGTLRFMRTGGNVQQGPGGWIHDLAAIAYSAAITIDASASGSWWRITPNNGVAFTINAPTNPVSGQIAWLTIRNASGGALGAVTFNAVFKTAGFVAPLNGFSASAKFRYDGANWVQLSLWTSVIPN